MKIYAVRHGESVANKAGVYCGWNDVDLTEQGEKDALLARELLKDVSFDKVYSSDLLRAKHTAAIALPNATPETTPLLREISVGNLAGASVADYPLEQRMKFRREGYREFGGETHDDFLGRAREFMALLKTLDCENVAVFSHAGLILTMLEEVLAAPIVHQNVRCANCTVAVFEYINGRFRLHSWINSK